MNCRIRGCQWEVEQSDRRLCYAHEAWLESLDNPCIMPNPAPLAEEIFADMQREVWRATREK